MSPAPKKPLLHGEGLDLQHLREIARQFAEALEEPERVQELEVLLRRSLDRGG